MGYCSEIHVITSVEGFEKMRECIWELAKDRELSEDMVLFPKEKENPRVVFDFFEKNGDYVHFGFSWVKWYDRDTKVILFQDMLMEIGEEVAWKFYRQGEDSDDFETVTSEAEDYDMPYIELRPVICW